MSTSKPAVIKKAAAKKVPAKKVAKKAIKTSPKKSSRSATPARRPLVYADNETSFWVSNGEILNSLVALRDALARMERDVYRQHVSAEKNDFANWVEAVLCDGSCAEDLRGAQSPTAAKTVVVKHLKFYAA